MNELLSRFSGKCKVCKTTWESGAKIYVENGVDRWCASQACAKGGQTQEQLQPKPAPVPAQAAPTNVGLADFEHESRVHDALWKMATQKAEAVDFSAFIDDRERIKSKHILTQTFYYGLVAIHTGKAPKR